MIFNAIGKSLTRMCPLAFHMFEESDPKSIGEDINLAESSGLDPHAGF
jgi:hypothetical protein